MSKTDKFIDNIAKNFAPKWFELLKWFFIFGTITYIYKKTGNIVIFIIYIISYAVLFLCILKSTLELLTNALPKRKYSKLKAILVSIVLTVISELFIYYLLVSLVNQLVSQGLLH